MATIYLNRKDGKIVSFKFKVFLGKEASGKHIVKCKTWTPDREMTEKKLRALAEKEAILFEHEATARYEEEQKRFKPSEITFADFVEQVWLPSKINMDEVRTTTIVFHKSIVSIRMLFAVFSRCHQTIFLENFTKIIYVAVSNKLGNFYKRIIGIKQ